MGVMKPSPERNILKKDEEVMMKRISGESWRENFRHVNSESE
jgi:hypothetical protein